MYTNRRVPLCADALVDEDFNSGGKQLIPIVHCHGGMAGADEHMSIPMQFASHGFICFAPDFMEGQMCWTTDKDGNDIWYDSVHKFAEVP